MASMSITEIFEILPHRYPMLLVDKILEIEGTNKVRGLKNVTFNEPFFQGHYPGLPIMPGVLIIESMAQTAAVLLLSNGESKDFVPLIGSIDKAKFRRQVVPGDQLIIEAELLWMKAGVGKITAQATVEGDLAAKMEMTFKIQRLEEKR